MGTGQGRVDMRGQGLTVDCTGQQADGKDCMVASGLVHGASLWVDGWLYVGAGRGEHCELWVLGGGCPPLYLFGGRTVTGVSELCDCVGE